MLTDAPVDPVRSTRIEDMLSRLESPKGVSLFADKVIAQKGVQDLAKEECSTSPQAETIISRQDTGNINTYRPHGDFGDLMSEVMAREPSL